MTIEILLVIAIILVAIYLFTTEKFTVDTTALAVAAILMISGIVTPQEGLSGFSDVSTISVFALLCLSIGLESTGAVSWIGNWMQKNLVGSEVKTIIGLSLMVGVCSAFLNNTAIVAIMLPVVIELCRSNPKLSVSKLLMPLSFSAMAGGTMTIIGTSTNVVISGIYAKHFGEAFSIFEFSMIGICIFLTYLLYMIFLGRFLLPGDKQLDLSEDYDLSKYLTQVKVANNSPLVGHRFGESELTLQFGISVLELIRGEDEVWLPTQREKIRGGDKLLIRCDVESLVAIAEKLKLRVDRLTELDDQDLSSEHALLFEAVLGNNSFLLGQKLKDVDFRRIFHAVPLGIRRHGEMLETKLSEVELRFGDCILMEARRGKLEKFNNSRDFIVLGKVKKANLRPTRLKRSTLIILGVVSTVALGIFPLEVATLSGVVLMFVTGCVTPRYVYRKMEWRIIFLLAGLIPLGIAVEKVGLSDLVATGMLDVLGDNALLVIAALFGMTVLLTSFMSNSATAILLSPLAITMAQQLNLNPKAFLITVMFAASTSFLTPIGYQTNTLIYGPGKYTFGDYFRVGGILTILVCIVSTFLIWYLYL